MLYLFFNNNSLIQWTWNKSKITYKIHSNIYSLLFIYLYYCYSFKISTVRPLGIVSGVICMHCMLCHYNNY